MKIFGFLLLTLVALSSPSSHANDLTDEQETCVDETKKYVSEAQKRGAVLPLENVLSYYQSCVTELEAPSYRDRCGDRPGGAYDNCTN